VDGGSLEKVTRRLAPEYCESGDTNRIGSSGESGGEEHRILFTQGSKTEVHDPKMFSAERFSLVISKTDNLILSADKSPRALIRVFNRTTSPVSAHLGESVGCATGSVISFIFDENDLRTNEGAPGPPNLIIAPRLTR